jgi:tRNA nucleotidyltransferase/poly(A) polymerase
MEQMPSDLARASRWIATELGSIGQRAWLVGGAVRDLALERCPQDADLASAARPEDLERLFPRTHSVGRAFGTVVVSVADIDVQVTTFRAEAGYDDARRPREVRFSSTIEEDAARRDFTCNALYLDPLNDELRDPTGGLEDLAARRLCCVGEPAQRFAEDGLRILRLARLAAEYGFAVEPRTQAGAGRSLAALRGVSPERVLAEFTRMAEGSTPGRAFALLFEVGALQALPGFRHCPTEALGGRVDALKRLTDPSPSSVLALLFLPQGSAPVDASIAALRTLRPSRALERRVERTLVLLGQIDACLAELPRVPRSRWVRLIREEEARDALALHQAWHGERFARERTELEARRGSLGEPDLWPAALVTSAELDRAGVARGPRWAALLREAESAQLDGVFSDAEGARAWLRERAKE